MLALASISDCRKSRSTASKIKYIKILQGSYIFDESIKNKIDFINQINIEALKTAVFRASCLLLSKAISTVPSYADEFALNRFTFLFPRLPACR